MLLWTPLGQSGFKKHPFWCEASRLQLLSSFAPPADLTGCDTEFSSCRAQLVTQLFKPLGQSEFKKHPLGAPWEPLGSPLGEAFQAPSVRGGF